MKARYWIQFSNSHDVIIQEKLSMNNKEKLLLRFKTGSVFFYKEKGTRLCLNKGSRLGNKEKRPFFEVLKINSENFFCGHYA